MLTTVSLTITCVYRGNPFTCVVYIHAAFCIHVCVYMQGTFIMSSEGLFRVFTDSSSREIMGQVQCLAHWLTLTVTDPCGDLDWLWLTWLSVLSKCSWPAPLTLLVINWSTNLILAFRIRVSEKKLFHKQELVTGILPVIVENLDVQCYFVNKAMRVILRTTSETMWFILDLPPLQTDRK